MLRFILVLFFIAHISKTEAGQGCEHSGKSYTDGQQFDVGCKERCTCANGQVGCVPKCPPDIRPSGPNCQKIYEVGDCCGRYVCDQEAAKEKCDTERIWLDDNRAPWIIRFVDVHARGWKKYCTATLKEQTRVFTPVTCLTSGLNSNNITFIYPSAATQWEVIYSLAGGSGGWGFADHIQNLYLDPTVEYTPELHPVNQVYGHGDNFCFRNDCALYIISFNPLTNETQYFPSQRVGREFCPIPEGDENTFQCLKPDYSRKSQCTNFDGSPVMIKRNKTFYTVGVLWQSDETKPKNNQCDTNWPEYMMFRHHCYS